MSFGIQCQITGTDYFYFCPLGNMDSLLIYSTVSVDSQGNIGSLADIYTRQIIYSVQANIMQVNLAGYAFHDFNTHISHIIRITQDGQTGGGNCDAVIFLQCQLNQRQFCRAAGCIYLTFVLCVTANVFRYDNFLHFPVDVSHQIHRRFGRIVSLDVIHL